MPEMVVSTSEVRIRLSLDDFKTLVEGQEIIIEGDYNIARGGRKLLRIMLGKDVRFSKMLLTLINTKEKESTTNASS